MLLFISMGALYLHVAHDVMAAWTSDHVFLAVACVDCLQTEDLTVGLAAKLKETVNEVKAYRERYQAKDEDVKQLRRRRSESSESKLIIKEQIHNQVEQF